MLRQYVRFTLIRLNQGLAGLCVGSLVQSNYNVQLVHGDTLGFRLVGGLYRTTALLLFFFYCNTRSEPGLAIGIRGRSEFGYSIPFHKNT